MNQTKYRKVSNALQTAHAVRLRLNTLAGMISTRHGERVVSEAQADVAALIDALMRLREELMGDRSQH